MLRTVQCLRQTAKFEDSIFVIIFSKHVIENPESQSETKEIEICSIIENNLRALTLSYSDTMRKKWIGYTDFEDALGALQFSFLHL